MNSTLTRIWWLLALRGGLALVFGILACFWPGLALIYMLVVFVTFALVDGVIALAAAIRGEARGGLWWALLLEGLFGISAGLIGIFYPILTELALLFVIAYWAIVTGVFKIVAAIRLRKEIEGEWALALSGVLSIVFGAAVIAMPVAGALAIAWLIAAYSIIVGALLLAVAIRLRPGRYAPTAPAAGRFSRST